LPAGGAREPFASHAVFLRSQRVDREQQRAAPVVEGVEQDLNLVVGVDVVAVGERRAHDVAVRLERPNAEVHRVGSIEDEDLGRVRRGPAIDGTVLREAREQRGLAPDRLVQHAVEANGFRLDARNPNLGLTQAAVVHVLLASRLDEEQKGGEHGTKTTMRKGECGMRNVRRE